MKSKELTLEEALYKISDEIKALESVPYENMEIRNKIYDIVCNLATSKWKEGFKDAKEIYNHK